MSWSFQAVGVPEKVAAALDAHSESISKNPEDICRKEFDSAKPHLIALVNQNFVRDGSTYQKICLRIVASGSASRTRAPGEEEWKLEQSSVSCNIETLWNHVG